MTVPALDDAWAHRPAVEQARAIRDGEITSATLLELYLRRCREQSHLNAVVTLAPDEARRAAHRADLARDAGATLGPLHGVPFTVKDSLATAGLRSTSGARELADHVPRHDAVAVARLRDAGAVLFGKTNCARWCADVQTYNDVHGVTGNPHDPARTAGGSSGGSAAAVAAGLTAFEVGTDIGGSIRIPSAMCGVFGHKPTYGLVPTRGQLTAVGDCDLPQDVNVVGPIARSADDLAVLLDVLAGPDAPASAAWTLTLPDPKPLAGCRVAVWTQDGPTPVARGVRDAIDAVAARLRATGAHVATAEPPPGLARLGELWLELALATTARAFGDTELGRTLAGSHFDWQLRREEQLRAGATWLEHFAGVDVLVCPVWPVAAYPHDLDGTLADRTVDVDGTPVVHTDAMRWNTVIGLLGLPSTVAPVGTVDGLPVGVQLVGRPFADRQTIAVARELAPSAITPAMIRA